MNTRILKFKKNGKNSKVYLINTTKIKPDTIEINDVVELDTVMIRLERFLQVVYRIRGGSGEHLRVTKIFCINNGFLKESMSLLTIDESFSPANILYISYSVKISMSYKDDKYYVDLVEVIQKHENTSKRKYHLQFELKNFIFFSQKHRDNLITICNEDNKRIKEYYKISLLRESYIYFKNVWYQQGRKCYVRM